MFLQQEEDSECYQAIKNQRGGNAEDCSQLKKSQLSVSQAMYFYVC